MGGRPVNQVRLRTRKPATTLAAVTRAREIQGKLTMPGLDRDAGAETEAALPDRTAWRVDEVGPLPHRRVLATWPDAWRERWGRRANELEEAGAPWRDAEGTAFVEVCTRFRAAGLLERD